MNYETFRAEYLKAFERFMSYTPTQVGSRIYASKLADLEEAHPDFLEKLEAEAGS